MNAFFFLVTLVGLTCVWGKKSECVTTRMCSGILTNEKTLALKGIAAVLIILGHCAIKLQLDGKYTFVNVGWYCVALFFFLSGYGLVQGYQKKDNYMNYFLKKRIIKVLIPFFTAHIIYGIVKCYMGQAFTVKDILYGMLGQSTIVENSWYPIAAIIMYIVFFLSMSFSRSLKIGVGICANLIIIITIMEYLFFSTKSWWYISNYAFVIGMIVSIYDEQFIYWKTYIILGISGYIMVSIVSRYSVRASLMERFMNVGFQNLKSALLVLVVVSIALKFFGGTNLFAKYLGEISYELYLMHGLSIFILFESFGEIQLPLFFVLVFGFSTVVATIVHFIDQIIISNALRTKSRT